MDRPTWRRREEWARAEAMRTLDQGVLPSPTLVLFEGDEATLYVRSGPKLGPELDQRLAWNELFALGYALRPSAAMVVLPARLRTDSDGALAGEAEGEAAIGVEWLRRRDDGDLEHGGVFLPYGLDDDGGLSWHEPAELPDDDGPLRDHLAAVVTGRWTGASGEERTADLGMSPAGLAYSLRCFGLTVGVAGEWFSRYGFDVPIDPALVRREDRARAEAWQAHRGRVAEVRR